jgi:hypothetical protein
VYWTLFAVDKHREAIGPVSIAINAIVWAWMTKIPPANQRPLSGSVERRSLSAEAAPLKEWRSDNR